MVIPDALEDRRFTTNPVVQGEDGLRFFAAMQLVDDDKLPLGALWVYDTEPRDGLSNSEIASLRRISQAVMALMHRHAVVTSE